jgi:hypothetical protein
MKHRLTKFAAIGLLLMVAVACNATQGGGSPKKEKLEPTNAIYHWKGVYNPSAEELAFMESHEIGRLYIRLFDIAAEYNSVEQFMEAVPIATTRFDAAVPCDVEVVPVTYITVEGLRQMEDYEVYYAGVIVERIMAMASYNELGDINEIQYDCDWTESTRHIFFTLCRETCDILHERGMKLSVTVRLHQMREEAPMADRGVLMLYNTGNLRSAKTENSILDIDDIEPYLKKRNYPFPLDYAYPTFGWGVVFNEGRFSHLVTNYDTVELGEGETMRVERPTAEEILEVKGRVTKAFGKPCQSNIIYHLDSNQLKNYTDDEINEIFARN